jgi:two-component system response regulator QseB
MIRVLVVDDDAAAADGLRMLLASDGYEVVACDEPTAALEQLGRTRFDAVITDLEMPRVHGVEVVRAARAASSGTLVYVVSAYSDSPASEEARAAGATRVFGKPLDYDVLADDLAARLASQ